LAGPDILSRGFVYMRESGEMISEGQSILFHALREALSQSDCNEYKLREAMSAALQPFLFEKTERHPMILSMIMTLDEE
jgi:ribonuclease J